MALQVFQHNASPRLKLDQAETLIAPLAINTAFVFNLHSCQRISTPNLWIYWQKNHLYPFCTCSQLAVPQTALSLPRHLREILAPSMNKGEHRKNERGYAYIFLVYDGLSCWHIFHWIPNSIASLHRLFIFAH